MSSSFGREPSSQLSAGPKITPQVSFTGHEQLDAFGLVHMNGRVYDPALGRFIQADPVLDSGIQGLNRYSYVLNNPMTLTDPNGHWSVPTWVRAVAAIAVTVYTGGVASAGLTAGTLTASEAFAIVVAGGFTAGAIQSGSLEGGLYGAFSSAMFFGAGQLAGEGFEYGFNTETAGLIVAHGIAGGVMSDLQGGKFGHGFLSAGLSAGASPYLSGLSSGEGVVASVVLGGTISAATGGKFANGALTAAFSYSLGRLADPLPASQASATGEPTAYVDQTSPNSRFRYRRGKGIDVQCHSSGCDINGSFSVGADDTLTDDAFDRAFKDLSAWNGPHLVGDKIYRVNFNFSVDHSNPDVLFSATGENTGGYTIGLGRGKQIYLGNSFSAYTSAHEFGHLIGLGHRLNFTRALMSYANPRSSRQVYGADVEALATMYRR